MLAVFSLAAEPVMKERQVRIIAYRKDMRISHTLAYFWGHFMLEEDFYVNFKQRIYSTRTTCCIRNAQEKKYPVLRLH